MFHTPCDPGSLFPCYTFCYFGPLRFTSHHVPFRKCSDNDNYHRFGWVQTLLLGPQSLKECQHLLCGTSRKSIAGKWAECEYQRVAFQDSWQLPLLHLRHLQWECPVVREKSGKPRRCEKNLPSFSCVYTKLPQSEGRWRPWERLQLKILWQKIVRHVKRWWPCEKGSVNQQTALT